MSLLDVLFGVRIPRTELDAHVSRWIRTQLAMLSFWAAIFLPVLYVPLLVTRIDTTQELLLFFGLFGVHIIALLGGRSHQGVFNR